MFEPESEYLYIKKIDALEKKIRLLQAILRAILDGRTVMKQEIERILDDDLSG
jgi:hypothetical protein